VIGRELEVLFCEVVHDGVDLDDGGVDAMGDKRSGRGADAQAAVNVSNTPPSMKS